MRSTRQTNQGQPGDAADCRTLYAVQRHTPTPGCTKCYSPLPPLTSLQRRLLKVTPPACGSAVKRTQRTPKRRSREPGCRRKAFPSTTSLRYALPAPYKQKPPKLAALLQIGSNLHYVYPFFFRSFGQRFFENFSKFFVAQNF